MVYNNIIQNTKKTFFVDNNRILNKMEQCKKKIIVQNHKYKCLFFNFAHRNSKNKYLYLYNKMIKLELMEIHSSYNNSKDNNPEVQLLGTISNKFNKLYKITNIYKRKLCYNLLYLCKIFSLT